MDNNNLKEFSDIINTLSERHDKIKEFLNNAREKTIKNGLTIIEEKDEFTLRIKVGGEKSDYSIEISLPLEASIPSQKEWNGEVKITYIKRILLEKIYSYYWDAIKFGSLDEAFDEVININSMLLDRISNKSFQKLYDNLINYFDIEENRNNSKKSVNDFFYKFLDNKKVDPKIEEKIINVSSLNKYNTNECLKIRQRILNARFDENDILNWQKISIDE